MRDQDSPLPYVQYVDGGNDINFIFMRDQKLRRRLSWTVYVAFANNINFIAMQAQNSPSPYDQYVVILRKNINFIFMRDWNSPAFMTKFDGGNNINFIFMTDQKFAINEI